jgi:hypothetical protein
MYTISLYETTHLLRMLKMQRTAFVYTLKVVKIIAYEEETLNYVQISCIDDVCSWDTETN